MGNLTTLLKLNNAFEMLLSRPKERQRSIRTSLSNDYIATTYEFPFRSGPNEIVMVSNQTAILAPTVNQTAASQQPQQPTSKYNR